MSLRRAVIAVLVGCVLVASGCVPVGGCGGTPVPDVKGLTAAQAEQALVTAGFKAGKVSYDAVATGAKGAVIAQDPAAGARATQGAIVNMTVVGEPPATVPPVEGLTTEAAAAVLAGSRLALGLTTQSYSTTVTAGLIIVQFPPAGVEVPGGSAIGVVVSKGPEPPPQPAQVKVPAVKGLKLAVAQAKIEAAGLKWSHETGPGDGMTAVGFVYKQFPAAGKTVDAGSVVVLTTWKGP